MQLQHNPLIAAVYKRDFEKAKTLLDEGVDVNASGPNGVTALIYAANEGLLELVKMLVLYKADMNAFSQSLSTPLIAAISKGYQDIVCFLIDQGVDVNQIDSQGRTALFYTIIPNEQPELIHTLLACGAQVNIRDGKLLTPLWYARFYRHEKAEELLRAAGGIT